MTLFPKSLTRLLLAGGLCAALAPSLAAQTVVDACYVDKTGIIYLIDPTGTKAGELPAACLKADKHVRFSWVDALGADHGALTGKTDDDHPQYLLANGVRDGSFAVTGSGSIPVEGVGSRMMWYGNKAAFRAGRVDFGDNAWDDALVGFGSVALGQGTRAEGEFSMAFGYNTRANGQASATIGVNSRATGTRSMALGDGALANHDNTFVFADGNFFGSTAAKQFLVQARGGFGVGVTNPIPNGLSVGGMIESRSGGVKFPDGTTQTTAATPFNTGVDIQALERRTAGLHGEVTALRAEASDLRGRLARLEAVLAALLDERR